MDECYQKINNLVTKFVKVETPTPAISLLSSLRSIVSKHCSGESKLVNLRELDLPMQGIAEELGRQSEKDQFKKLCDLIDDILLELNEINDVDPKLKSKNIAWLMSYYSCCCQYLGNYEKPIELYTQAIDILQSAYGKNARKFRLYGFSHGNLGRSYENNNEVKKALVYYKKALELYNFVTDWPDEQPKKKRIKFAMQDMERIENMLSI